MCRRRSDGSAESKHGSSTSSWESGGGCTTYVWAQKCPEAAENMQLMVAGKPDVSSLLCVSFSYIV